MKEILKYNLIFFVFLFFGVPSLKSQDLHYSQFYFSPVNVNPALTGIFSGDQRFSVSIRDQWRSIPVPWLTTSMGYDRMIIPKNNKDLFFGAGGVLNYDRQGDSKINLTNLNFSGSANYILTENHVISFGALLGFSTRGFNLNTLSFDKQWNGVSYDPSIDPGEAFDYDRFSFIETGIGVNYRYQVSKRTKFDIGVGALHLYRPNYTFNSTDKRKLPLRITPNAVFRLQLLDNLDLQVDALHQIQDAYSETIFGAMVDIYLNKKRGSKTNLMIGGAYRTSGSFFPKAVFKFNEFVLGLSYDVDVSDFSNNTSSRGGPEIHFNYIITHVKPFEKQKICPIF